MGNGLPLRLEHRENEVGMAHTAHLLIIDPQNDFCDLPQEYCPTDPGSNRPLAPALPVPGAHADMQRVAAFIRQVGATLARITVTLDSHHRVDIAHPTFWRTANGGAVPPFTPITAAEVRAGKLLPRRPDALERVLNYLDELDRRGRYTLMVWPVHCEIGTWGHCVHADVRSAYSAWEDDQVSVVQKFTKGENPWTEHYSALLAEVPLADDPATGLNSRLIADLDAASTLLVCGEASSHCVRATVEHLVAHLPDQTPARMRRIVLLTDCMSPVSGFEAAHRDFLEAMAARGVSTMTSIEAARTMVSGTGPND